MGLVTSHYTIKYRPVGAGCIFPWSLSFFPSCVKALRIVCKYLQERILGTWGISLGCPCKIDHTSWPSQYPAFSPYSGYSDLQSDMLLTTFPIFTLTASIAASGDWICLLISIFRIKDIHSGSGSDKFQAILTWK